MKQRFLVVYEHGKRNYGGFAPDIPGCMAMGKTLPKIRQLMREALDAHLNWKASDGDPMPKPETTSFDFAAIDDSEGEVDHYMVEWMDVEVPVSIPKGGAMANA